MTKLPFFFAFFFTFP
ncbi:MULTISPECIES: hypothetical protein [Pantoea]|nr:MULTISPECIES: hypothetical protein [Pantoea]